jgi:hypothetical protein
MRSFKEITMREKLSSRGGGVEIDLTMKAEQKRLMEHYRTMVINVLNRKSKNHKDYGKNYHYFIQQANTTIKILRKKY